MTPTAPPAVRVATRADVAAIARTHQRAFASDPTFRYLVPDRSRWGRLGHHLFVVAAAETVDDGTVWVAAGPGGEIAAAAVWARPGHRRRPTSGLGSLPHLARLFGRRIPDALRYGAAMRTGHPEEPHWYLAVLGTEPAHQGRGLGAALLAPVLADADEEGVGTYLETATEANVAWYARHGFRVTAETRPAPAGPPMWLLWRAPR